MTNVIGFDPVAWSINGGSHPGSLLRKLAYAATQGEEGIVTPLDCKVRQTSTASGRVQIDTGAIVIRNRSTGGTGQSYVASASALSLMDIDPTGGTSRSDLIVVRIEDPEDPQWPTPSAGAAPTFQYTKPFVIKNVPGSTTSAVALNLGYSAYALARVDLPAGTTNITTAMIKDLRKVARPRLDPQQYTAIPTQAMNAGQQILGTQATYINWPTAANRNVDIPSWAAQVIVEVNIGGVRSNPSGMWGQIRARIGASGSAFAVVTQGCGYDVNTKTVDVYDRLPLFVADTQPVAVEIRGTTQPFAIEARADGNGGSSLEVDVRTVISTKLTFKEVAA